MFKRQAFSKILIRFIPFLILISVSTIVIQYMADEFVFGCGTSPYGAFKQEYCDGVNADKGTLDIYGRELVSLPSSIIRIAMIEFLPIYNDHEFWFSPPTSRFALNFPVSSLVQFHVFYKTGTSKTKIDVFNFIFLSLDILYVIAASIGVTKLWQRGTKKAKIGVAFIFLFIYKWSVIITIPLALFIIRPLFS